MMRRMIGVLFVAGLSVSNAWGASVVFDQASVTLYNDPAFGNATATLEVSLEAAAEPNIASFTTFGLLIGSTVTDLRITDFAFSPSFEDLWASGLLAVDVPGPGLYGSDVFAEGFLFSGEVVLPATVGTLTIDATGVTPGEYPQAISVDGTSLIDDGRSVLQDADSLSEALLGFARIVVVGGPATDADGDGVADQDDAFPHDPTETTDTDTDGLGNNADSDDDGDGVDDDSDAFPLDPAETTDTDGDGTGNNADPDDDDDGVNDAADAFPQDADETADRDGDGVGDNADAFPDDPTATTTDGGNGIGDDTDAGPPAGGRLCGVAMLGSFVLTMLGLFSLRLSYRRPNQRRHDYRAG